MTKPKLLSSVLRKENDQGVAGKAAGPAYGGIVVEIHHMEPLNQ